ncbi:hypothetical protein CHS0354_041997 [Potamilus streckersoni]|nr:hypothetical protein CHS0354_041997 [Potamilus streckersoni]
MWSDAMNDLFGGSDYGDLFPACRNSRRRRFEANLTSYPTYRVIMDMDGTTPPVELTSVDASKFQEEKPKTQKTADYRNSYRLPNNPPESLTDLIRKEASSCCSCTPERRRKCLEKLFPVYRIMKKYNWKTDLPNDVIAGLTVGIMQLPQGMAYAMLAELPPVIGLYMSFFPVLIYFLLGTSRHISMGTVAVVSLLVGSVIARFYDLDIVYDIVVGDGNSSFYNGTGTGNLSAFIVPSGMPLQSVTKSRLPDDVKIAIATSLSLLVGIVQILMGICHLGFVTTYMSDALISGFTTGCAVHVFTSQVKYIFGLKIPRSDGMFQIIKTYIYIFEYISQTNYMPFVISVICITILYVVKVYVNQKYKSKLKIPIPIELIVVILGTVASYFANLAETHQVKVVGKVPAGLPTPSIPTMVHIDMYIIDIFIIAIIAFAQSVSLAALMAKKHSYSFDANQELIAYGAGSVFGSFFSCFPFAGSVSRSSVQESAGGKTQLTSVFSAILVLVVILVIGPLFEPLPSCVLSSIIVVALRSMFLQVQELPKIWRISRFDFLIWIVTFLCVVILHVDYGLLIGIVFSFFTVVIRSQKIKVVNLEKILEEDRYENPAKYYKTEAHPGMKIINFNSPLYYANGDIFVSQVYRVTGLTPEKVRKQLKKDSIKDPLATNRLGTVLLIGDSNLELHHNGKAGVVSNGKLSSTVLNLGLSSPLQHIIIDCSQITFIDSVGAKILKQIFEEYGSIDVDVFLAEVSDNVWDVLQASGFLDKYQDCIYVSVQDAVNSAFRLIEERQLLKKKLLLPQNNDHDEPNESDKLLTDQAVI